MLFLSFTVFFTCQYLSELNLSVKVDRISDLLHAPLEHWDSNREHRLRIITLVPLCRHTCTLFVYIRRVDLLDYEYELM